MRPDYNNDDRAVLTGLRPDGTQVGLSGMSDGTRDPLYLSLRLAAPEQHLQDYEPMPLILDDLLITFDGQRPSAIITQLAPFSCRTQIFLFTHHQHLVNLCKDSLSPTQFTLHELPRLTNST